MILLKNEKKIEHWHLSLPRAKGESISMRLIQVSEAVPFARQTLKDLPSQDQIE